ncbi:MAG: N-acetylmuramoyl-L-alanine amidase [Chitinophagaceae bacterium]
MKRTLSLIAMMWMLLFALPSCTPNPYVKTNRSYKKQAKSYAKILSMKPEDIRTDSSTLPRWWVGTTNFNMRKPNFVIIHHTAQNSCLQTLQTFTLPRTQVSAHYVICKDGVTRHMLNDYLRSWHGGVAKWGSLTDINSASIGIELDNNGFESFPAPQINSLIQLLDTLKRRYSIPIANFIGHADIAPTRKNDPNIYFPWKTLAEKGYGSWYTDTTTVFVPETFNNIHALRIIGYDTRDSISAIKAFKRHFVQDTSGILNDSDRKILFNLVSQ